MDMRAGLIIGSTDYEFFCINRTLIEKRLLVEFSYEYPTLYLYLEVYSLVRSLDLESLVVATTERLAGVVSSGRIHSEKQGSYSDKIFTFYGKL